MEDKIFAPTYNQFQRVKNDPYFANHKFVTVSIADLIRDNDLDNPASFTRHGLWGDDHTKYKYNKYKDEGLIYATKNKEGQYKLGDGRHRIRALANSGYTHANIPVLDDVEEMKRLQLI